MNITIQSKFIVDLYRNENGTLKYITNEIVDSSSINIIVDTVTPQQSKIKCADVPDLQIGDFGILKNEKRNIVFVISNIERQKDIDEVTLSINVGVDMLTYKYFCFGAKQHEYKSPSFWKLNNLVTEFSNDLSELEHVARIKVPYFYAGETSEVSVEFGNEGCKTHAQIIREKSRTNRVEAKFDMVTVRGDSHLTAEDYKIQVKLSNGTSAIVNLNLNDASVIDSYKVDTSSMQYNVLLFQYVGGDVGTIIRVDVDGNIQNPYKSDGSPNSFWEDKAILPAIVERKIVDPKSGDADAFTSAKNALLEQYYSSNIEIIARIDNPKIDLSNLDKLFSMKFILWRNGTAIRTVCTRYEWNGGDTVLIKFGNARGKLTEKIQKLIQKGGL